ncbi:Threonylcarbamoyl-AMP synthase [Candidatus Terasakiella magnetica]|uniref:Threonylcarbamoyl-AMP synthase n=1 Tax=Candidatus Terasakiella magnetica TaxID=1867952 RepID=A0A1C3RJY5_9PROT|nr:L-threonylcarbamoyladenylate synthase [Candidatus Terasakiella magnetica]SCA57602.1 Threonylcarbamoyl-AMP synthase [Candidatus Terasakiella magnetica]
MSDAENIFPPTTDNLARAGEHICAGRLVAFPTETVYGLGADATDEEAVASIFAAKERPSFNPLIVHVPDMETARKLVEFTPAAEKLADAFWPGALTLVLPRKNDSGLSLLVSAGLDTVAIRLPNHPIATALLKQSGRPIAAPSANKSGQISPTQANHVAQSLGAKVDMILDGGPCEVGLESTVVDACGAQVGFLRPGGISIEELEGVVGKLIFPDDAPDAPKSPGMLTSHYAPNLAMRLNAKDIRQGDILLGFGPECTKATLNLSPSGNLNEAAANLFAMMRELDVKGYKCMAVSPIPNKGLGLAINDRLIRAAAPRS